MTPILTNHSVERAKERCGWNRSALDYTDIYASIRSERTEILSRLLQELCDKRAGRHLPPEEHGPRITRFTWGHNHAVEYFAYDGRALLTLTHNPDLSITYTCHKETDDPPLPIQEIPVA